MTHTTTPGDEVFDGDVASGRVARWLDAFEGALRDRDVERAVDLFASESYWRDIVAFTWNIVTVENRDAIRGQLTATADADPGNFVASPATEADGVVTAAFTFETRTGRGEGVIRLVDDTGVDRAFTLMTSLAELKGYEEARRERRPLGSPHRAVKNRSTWSDVRQHEADTLGVAVQPYVLVVGGGQGGIALGARLRQLGVPSLVIDKHARPGDQWRSRYKSLSLHDPVWMDHLPYLKFPDNWPVYSPKDKIADWLEAYVSLMEVPYWGSTVATGATWSEATQEWTVDVERDGVATQLRPRHLVFATGASGKPRMPEVPGIERFRGDVHHSSAHPGPDRYRGRKAVVIGSNNSAFDICGALWENDADVTMVQRSSTHIAKSETLNGLLLGDSYSEAAVAAGVTTEMADLFNASVPYRVLPALLVPAFEKMAEIDRDFYDRLRARGFALDFGEDGSGLPMKYVRRASGYYIDVGSADLVADGEVALARGQFDHLTEDAVVLADGTELPADVVVFATGYLPMNMWVADLLGQETADRLGRCWGLGSGTTNDPGPWEGELRNMWKPTQVQNLWIHGGNLQQTRFYSLPLALQLKARYEQIPTPVTGLQAVHHAS